MNRIQSFLFIIMLTALFSASYLVDANNVAGSDWKSVSGGICAASKGANEKYLLHRHAGTINTHGKNKVWVFCPIFNDERNANSLTGVGARIYQGASDSTRCLLRSSDSEGTVIRTSSKTIRGNGWIHWDAPQKFFHGMVTVGCQLPPNATLFRIWYREKGTTDRD